MPSKSVICNPNSVINSFHAPTFHLANHTLVTLSPRGLQPRSPFHRPPADLHLCTYLPLANHTLANQSPRELSSHPYNYHLDFYHHR